jgi:hypothetical protein
MNQHFCFADPSDRYALFIEGFVRGHLAAALDFPHFKSLEESEAQALVECADVQSDVCCIPHEDAFKRLVGSAWISAYVAATKFSSERKKVFQTYHLKNMSRDEAIAFVRDTFLSGDDTQAEMKRAYKLIEQGAANER